MSDFQYAQRQLSAIRSLMEHATVYRAVSILTAFTGGLLSLGGFALAYYGKHQLRQTLAPREFLSLWLTILGLTVLMNGLFLMRDSVRRGRHPFSERFHVAILSIAPAFLLALTLSFVLHRPIHLAIMWITLYGVALLATQTFAPRSLVLLGSAFFLTGLVLAAAWKHLLAGAGPEPSPLIVSGLMAATFGGYHLAYVAVAWALGEERDPQPLTEPPREPGQP